MAHHMDDGKDRWKDGWRDGWKEGWEEGRREGLSLGRQVELKAPIILGAVDNFIPYEDLLNGFTVEMDVNGFTENELVRLFVPIVPPEGGLVLSARFIVSRSAIESGFLVHGFNEDDVRYLAGKDIQVYFTRMSLFPVPESPRSTYRVGAPAERLSDNSGARNPQGHGHAGR